MNALKGMITNVTRNSFISLDIVEVHCNKSLSELIVFWDLPSLVHGRKYSEQDYDRIERKLNSGVVRWRLIHHFTKRLRAKRFISMTFKRKSMERYLEEIKFKQFGGVGGLESFGQKYQKELLEAKERESEMTQRSHKGKEEMNEKYQKYIDDVLD